MNDDDFKLSESSCASQRAGILEFLTQYREIATITAREGLGICHPAGRVCELRKAGWHIETHRGWAYDAQGRKHANACYVLIRGTPC